MCMDCGCGIANDKKSSIMVDGKVVVTHDGMKNNAR